MIERKAFLFFYTLSRVFFLLLALCKFIANLLDLLLFVDISNNVSVTIAPRYQYEILVFYYAFFENYNIII